MNLIKRTTVWPLIRNTVFAVEKEYSRRFYPIVNTILPLEQQSQISLLHEEIKEFTNPYTDVLNELTEAAERGESKVAAEWFRKALHYNLSVSSKKNGLMTVLAYKELVRGGNQLTTENLRLSHLLGWCLELQHCTILITDDIIDNSTTRRDQLCWHRRDDVGLNAINDALLFENGIYELLRRHFRHLHCYVQLLELFQQNTFKCMLGQSLDMLISRRNVSTFSVEAYTSIVRNKTSSHFFYLPIALALHLAGISEQQIYDDCERITFEFGNFCQAQNDFLDCFGDPNETGKLGTDIQANKCTWLAVKCMERADERQRSIMEKFYGKNDPQEVARVKELYEELDLIEIYTKYEKETYNNIETMIFQACNGAPRKTLLKMLNQINQRDIK
uniref:Farnesyl pyrophosphate synthase n=2 Tax=Ceratitis capitata TaxID=7213 RepID=W8BFH9_CERCA